MLFYSAMLECSYICRFGVLCIVSFSSCSSGCYLGCGVIVLCVRVILYGEVGVLLSSLYLLVVGHIVSL